MRSVPRFPRFPPHDREAALHGVTPLELMFDLAGVVAIGAAAGRLSEGFVSADIGAALTGFLCSFFMIGSAWAAVIAGRSVIGVTQDSLARRHVHGR